MLTEEPPPTWTPITMPNFQHKTCNHIQCLRECPSTGPHHFTYDFNEHGEVYLLDFEEDEELEVIRPADPWG